MSIFLPAPAARLRHASFTITYGLFYVEGGTTECLVLLVTDHHPSLSTVLLHGSSQMHVSLISALPRGLPLLTRLALPARGGGGSRDDGFLLAREVAIRLPQAPVARALVLRIVC